MHVPIPLRSLVVRPIKWALERSGRVVVDRNRYVVLDRNRYGYDALIDIKRLSQAWQYPIDVFFDVGANEGQTILRARHVFKNCAIKGFEPHPDTFIRLTANMQKVPNVELLNVALGSDIGDKIMFEYDRSLLNSLLSNAPFAVRFANAAKEILVHCTTIDRYCSERHIERIDVLKIDTEGFDYEVLKGATSMLAQQAVRFIYFEFNDIAPKSGTSGGALAPIDQLVRPYGYRFIATYNDYVEPDGELFLVSNALYALPDRKEGGASW
jgi:FkbM family methyltransferase